MRLRTTRSDASKRRTATEPAVQIESLRPGGYRLTTELHVPAPLEEVFDFFGDAFELETITPPWLHFSVQTEPPIDMRLGTTIDYRLQLCGLPIRWRSRINIWEPPCSFVDEQLIGPYRKWRHMHTFAEDAKGTCVRDVVGYSVPLGRLMHPLFVRRSLIRIFEFRRAAMARRFADNGKTSASETAA